MRPMRHILVLVLCVSAAAVGSWLAFRRPTDRSSALPVETPTDGLGCCGRDMPDPEAAGVADVGSAESTTISHRNAPGPAPEGMVWIPAGRFLMGSNYALFADARPIHPVELDGFWMDRTPVTNDQF